MKYRIDIRTPMKDVDIDRMGVWDVVEGFS
jgi:hypothetical protein